MTQQDYAASSTQTQSQIQSNSKLILFATNILRAPIVGMSYVVRVSEIIFSSQIKTQRGKVGETESVGGIVAGREIHGQIDTQTLPQTHLQSQNNQVHSLTISDSNSNYHSNSVSNSNTRHSYSPSDQCSQCPYPLSTNKEGGTRCNVFCLCMPQTDLAVLFFFFFSVFTSTVLFVMYHTKTWSSIYVFILLFPIVESISDLLYITTGERKLLLLIF